MNNLFQSIIVCGREGYTRSMMFEIALHWAGKGHRVMYIMQKKLEQLPPDTHDKMAPCKDVLQQIRLVYTSTYESLINELLNLNRYAVIPSVLLIGDIDHFIESSTQTETREMLACKLYATISYIMNICSKLLKNKTFFCGTLEGDVDKNQTFSEMYFDRFWTICDTDEMVHLKMLTNANHESYRFQKLDNESLVLKEIVKQVVNS